MSKQPNRGSPEWRKWAAKYEDTTTRQRIRAERRKRRDDVAAQWDKFDGVEDDCRMEVTDAT